MSNCTKQGHGRFVEGNSSIRETIFVSSPWGIGSTTVIFSSVRNKWWKYVCSMGVALPSFYTSCTLVLSQINPVPTRTSSSTIRCTWYSPGDLLHLYSPTWELLPHLASGHLCEANMTGKLISSFRFTVRCHSFRASGLCINSTALGSESWVVALSATSIQSSPLKGKNMSVVLFLLIWKECSDSMPLKEERVCLVYNSRLQAFVSGRSVQKHHIHSQEQRENKRTLACSHPAFFTHI